MAKFKDVDLNQLFMKAHKLGVKNAIDLAARTKTSLVICKQLSAEAESFLRNNLF